MTAGTLLALAGSLGTAAAAPAGSRSPDTGTAAAQAGGTSRSTDGVWRLDGYGMVVSVRGGELRSWDTTAISCIPALAAPQQGAPAPDGTVRFDAGDFTLTVRPQARDRAVLRVLGTVGDRGMRRIGAVPPLCGRAQPTGPVASFDVYWQTFKENYAFFASRGVDWEAARAEYRPKVHARTTPDQLFDILSEMTAPLQDAHVALGAATPELTRSFEMFRPGTTPPTDEYDRRIRKFIERRDLGGTPLEQHAKGAVGYAELPGGIAYLRISRFGDYAPGTGDFEADSAELTRVLDRIITRTRTTGPGAWRGLIIDARFNQGGSDALGLQIAARLTNRSYPAYAKQARNHPDDDTRFTRRQTLHVVPATGSPRYTGPIALLTSGSTVSAGETFTKALAERPESTTLIGANTQGVLSDTLGRSLPNGWQFSLSNEKYTNPREFSYEGPGIPPHISTPVFTEKEFAADRDSAFDRARALLTRRP